MITLRSNRIIILAFVLVLATTLYLFYPSDHFKSPHTPLDPYNTYEAGGIDSDHWRDPVKPHFAKDDLDGDEDEGLCVGRECDNEDTRQTNPDPGAGGSGRVIKRPPKPEKMAPPPGAKIKDKTKVKPLSKEELAHQSHDEVVDDERLEDEKARGESVAMVKGEKGKAAKGGLVLEDSVLGGGVIMPKLENETAKAELGRAAWRVMHLMTLRYPDNPTEDDRTALKSYFHLFSRLYPCGECAEEFQKLLKQYPPQTSSRKTASMWMCSIHNMVNARLGKEEFDCLTLNDVYDCGCGPEGEGKGADGKVGTGKDGKGVAEKVKANVMDKAKANRPLGGMNVKEKSKDVAGKVGAAAAGAVGAGPVVEAVKKPLGKITSTDEEAEIVYNPKKLADKAKAAVKKVGEKVKGKVVGEEKEKEVTVLEDDGLVEDREAADQGIEVDETMEEAEEEQETEIERELVGEDSEADEDDSGVVEGDEEGLEVEDDSLR